VPLIFVLLFQDPPQVLFLNLLRLRTCPAGGHPVSLAAAGKKRIRPRSITPRR